METAYYGANVSMKIVRIMKENTLLLSDGHTKNGWAGRATEKGRMAFGIVRRTTDPVRRSSAVREI